MKICNYSPEEYIEKIKSFHGSVAPGMIAGGFMVDIAMKNLPEGEFFDVICETQHCLTDAVQLLTPCTIGNGWLKIVNISRFALIFFNKYTGDGVRIYIDIDKLNKWGEIRSWFLKEKPKHEQDSKKLVNQLIEAGTDYLGIMKVKVKKEYISTRKKISEPNAICPICNEVYYLKYGDKCPSCSGSGPYEIDITKGERRTEK
ncbi:MAG: tRNA CCA-pyrophosphorylase [Deltaproteobacteria bacterium]|nr:tRNA CCA-pyrophosphorylase [Deltaproteobacteria bacterium]